MRKRSCQAQASGCLTETNELTTRPTSPNILCRSIFQTNFDLNEMDEKSAKLKKKTTIQKQSVHSVNGIGLTIKVIVQDQNANKL